MTEKCWLCYIGDVTEGIVENYQVEVAGTSIVIPVAIVGVCTNCHNILYVLRPEPDGIKQCRVCGCTDENACMIRDDGGFKPCYWVEDDLCSACVGRTNTGGNQYGTSG